MRTIILDTDFLVFCAENKIDYVSEIRRLADFQYKLAVVECTLSELERVSQRKPSAVKVAKLVLNKHKVQVLPSTHSSTDNASLGMNPERICVATQDGELKRKLRLRKVPVFTARQRSRLVLDHPRPE